MKLNKLYILAGAVALGAAFTGCDKDGDTIYAPAPDAVDATTSSSVIVLDKNRLDALALTIYWGDNGDISLSDPEVEAPADAVKNTLQFSATPDFSSVVEETLENGTFYRQYTCRQLNNLTGRLGMEAGVAGKMYIRLKSYLAVNVEPVYGKTLELTVTPYFIDMSFALYLDKDRNETGKILISPESNGIYTGFIGAASWENWWLREGNSTYWGNDGVSGTALVLGNSTTGDEIWNFWYPGLEGCYYTTVDTPHNEWTALLIPSLTLAGDINGSMNYDRRSNVWSYTFDAQAKTYNVTISGTGKLYNASTGTDDAAAIDTPVGFGGTADALTFGSSATSVSINVAAAGETTIVLDLTNPYAWTIGTGEAPEAPAEVAPMLYLPGITDPWDFNSFIKLYNEDDLAYGGMNYVNSLWGYQIAVEVDNWSDIYTMVDGGNAFEGKLEFQGKNNVAAPEEGIYIFDVSLKYLNYKLTKVNKVSYTGLNDDWGMYEMQATDSPCVFTAEVEKKANTPWGVKILINEDWGLFFGGNGTEGELVLGKSDAVSGFTGDNNFENGTLILTVDLAKGTYTYTKK